MELGKSVFEFRSYQLQAEERKAVFNYKIKWSDREIDFSEELILPGEIDTAVVPQKLLDTILYNLHLILGISYWKTFCPKSIEIKTKVLNKKQAEFWNTIYTKGLAEFFYRNKIEPNGLINFPYEERSSCEPVSLKRRGRRLLGISGGKDSVVAAELFKEEAQEFSGFYVETNKRSELVTNIAQTIGADLLIARREIDQKVINSELKNAYQGHVPVSAIYAFIGVLLAVLYDYDSVAAANERSADFGNALGVNHQWSKSSEFETLFNDYVQAFITPGIRYFSPIRDLWEIDVVKIFARYPKYFDRFSSCNKNFRIGENSQKLWCGECPKCAFAFLMLAAFLPRIEVLKIFGQNLLEKGQLQPIYKQLLGVEGIKPFECVGTPEETKLAFFLTHLKKEFNVEWTIKTFKVLILGYAREGRATKEFLEATMPQLKVEAADWKDDANYLQKQKDYDFAIKTPGIPRNLVSLPYTTATNIFRRVVKNKVVGVTGTKGKSTTASLIYEILKAAGQKAHLIGNIGNPGLSEILHKIDNDDIFVYELSSYVLSDIDWSPEIAVVLNLFPEHLDYHGNLKSYYSAKKNIFTYSSENDYLIFNPKSGVLQSWAKEAQCKAMPFEDEFSDRNLETSLIGEHNRENIKAAITVTHLLHIPNELIISAVSNFKSLPHRLEFIGDFKSIRFYDDAISTTPQSTIAAIQSLPDIGTILLGGQDRGYDFTELVETIIHYKIPNIVFFPETGQKILGVLKFKTRNLPKILETRSMEEAVRFAYQHTTANSICLLSTASPSYSLWKNFEEKGELFKKFAEELSHEIPKKKE